MGCYDAGDPNCHAELGDTPGTKGLNDHTAMMALQWHRVTQGQKHVSPVARPTPRVTPRVRQWWEILGFSNKLPQTINAAPATVKFTDAMMTQVKNVYMIMVNNPIATGNSPAKFNCERAMRIAVYKDQTVRLAGTIEVRDNKHVQTPDDFIYLKGSGVLLDTDYEVIGVVHSHPDTDSFSGGDVASFVNYTIEKKQHMIFIVVCPKTLFMMVRTGKTYDIGLNPDKKQDVALKRASDLVKKGHSEGEAYLTAVKEMASKYDIALYGCKKSSQNDEPFKRLN
jgi:hypothetical protein